VEGLAVPKRRTAQARSAQTLKVNISYSISFFLF
jgi:hypothetical protein